MSDQQQFAVAASNLELVALSPLMGMEVKGVDLREPLDAATRGCLRQAYSDHLFLALPGEALSPKQQVQAASVFGPVLDEFADGSLHSFVSNVAPAYVGGATDFLYQSDLTNTDSPPWGISLYAMEISEGSPGTRFVNAQLAFERLAPELRKQLEDRDVRESP